MNVSICAAVLVIEPETNRILVTSRRDRPSALNLPCGKLDAVDWAHSDPTSLSDAVVACAARELLEETGLRAQNLVLLYCGICSDDRGLGFCGAPDVEVPEQDSIVFTFFARQTEGEPREMDGEPPPRWVEMEEFIANTPYTRYNQVVLELYERHFSWVTTIMQDRKS